jgi:hypothetical protein
MSQQRACTQCPQSFYGVTSGDPVQACQPCPPGRYGHQTGVANTTGAVLETLCPESCGSGEYLESRSHKCLPCPRGAYCPSNVDESGIQVRSGYWRMPNRSIAIVKCFNPCACLGARNPDLQTCGDTLDPDHDYAEQCNVQAGHRPQSRLCGACRAGYVARANGLSICSPCSAFGWTVFTFICFILVLLALVVFLVWTTVIQRGGKSEVSDGIKKVFLSFWQLTCLFMSMNIPWPHTYLHLFEWQGFVSTFGSELMNTACLFESLHESSKWVYYETLAHLLLVPFVLVVIWVSWHCGPCRHRFPFQERQAMRHGTVVLVLYMLYPSLTERVLSLWDCVPLQSTEGDDLGLFVLHFAPSIVCTNRLHTSWQHAVGLPGIFLCVLGFPLAGYMLLRAFRHKLDAPLTRMRLGVLYDGFRRESFDHELWVSGRKVVIILISLFVEDGLQVLVSVGVIGFFIVHTMFARPFQNPVLTNLEILLLFCSFVTAWIGGIFTFYPNCLGAKGILGWCLAGDIFVLIANAVVVVCTVGFYCRCLYQENNETFKRLVNPLLSSRCMKCSKTCCERMAVWWVCKPCCSHAFGDGLRQSEIRSKEVDLIRWSSNPLDHEMELAHSEDSSSRNDLPIS